MMATMHGQCVSFLTPPQTSVPTQQRISRLQARASSHGEAGTSGRDRYAYNAGSSSERQKATIEHVFSTADAGPGSKQAEAPWHMGWQMNERNIVWSNDLKLRLLQRHVAQELRLTDQEAQQRIIDVTSLLPGLATRLAAIKASTVVVLCADVKALAARLIQLKGIFPGGDAAKILLQSPVPIVMQDISAIQASADRLRDLLPTVDIDRLVEEYAQLLDVPAFEQALRDARHVMPDIDVWHMMHYNPSLIFGFQRGPQMIVYDEVPTQGAPQEFVRWGEFV